MQTNKPVEIILSEVERNELQAIVRRHSSPQAMVVRAKIILKAAGGMNNTAIRKALGCNRRSIAKWRNRWIEHSTSSVRERLKDAPRPGAEPKFTAEQVCQIMALACEKPEDHNYMMSHWSQNALAKAAISKGIVESISQRQVGRFLKSGRSSAR